MAKELENTNDIKDLDMSITNKQKFRIDGDMNRVIELDVSDLSISTRLAEAYPKLVAYVNDAQSQIDTIEDADVEALDKFAKMLTEIDTKMRELIDYIFDSPVSAKLAPSGTMYDPFNGSFRFELIIDKLIGLYSANIDEQFDKMKKKVSKHTNKYTKKYHK